MALSRFSLAAETFKRVPWGGVSGNADIVILGVDWSGATFLMEFRNEPGDQGDPLISLANASAGAEGISASYDAGYVHPTNVDENGDPVIVGATTIRPQINETTLEGLAYGADGADPVTLYTDLHATVPGLGKVVLISGTLIVNPGVTL